MVVYLGFLEVPVFLSWEGCKFSFWSHPCFFFVVDISSRVQSFLQGSQDYLSNHIYIRVANSSFLLASYTVQLVGMRFCF